MKKIFILALISVIITSAVGCSKGETKQAVSEDKAKEITIKYPKTQWYDAVYIADAKGFFAEQNIKVEYVGQVPAAQIVPAVAGRSIDFGLRHTPLIAMARAQGSPLKIVAAGAQTVSDEYTHMRYIVKKDSAIKDLSEAVGKKVAINSFGACSEFVTREYLKTKGVTGDVNFVVLPDAQQEQALDQGIIDIAIVHAPFSKKAVTNPNLRELTNDYDIDQGESGMCPYFTNEEFIKEDPEAVKGFVAAVGKASDWAKNNEEEAKKIIAEKLGIKVEEVEPWAYYEHQVIQKEAAEWWVNYLKREGHIKADSIKVEDLYTNEFNLFK
jgi:ABC-type nitrate/sulfonate/bicarbonate transport system substrate-binding protein